MIFAYSFLVILGLLLHSPTSLEGMGGLKKQSSAATTQAQAALMNREKNIQQEHNLAVKIKNLCDIALTMVDTLDEKSSKNNDDISDHEIEPSNIQAASFALLQKDLEAKRDNIAESIEYTTRELQNAETQLQQIPSILNTLQSIAPNNKSSEFLNQSRQKFSLYKQTIMRRVTDWNKKLGDIEKEIQTVKKDRRFINALLKRNDTDITPSEYNKFLEQSRNRKLKDKYDDTIEYQNLNVLMRRKGAVLSINSIDLTLKSMNSEISGKTTIEIIRKNSLLEKLNEQTIKLMSILTNNQEYLSDDEKNKAVAAATAIQKLKNIISKLPTDDKGKQSSTDLPPTTQNSDPSSNSSSSSASSKTSTTASGIIEDATDDETTPPSSTPAKPSSNSSSSSSASSTASSTSDGSTSTTDLGSQGGGEPAPTSNPPVTTQQTWDELATKILQAREQAKAPSGKYQFADDYKVVRPQLIEFLQTQSPIDYTSTSGEEALSILDGMMILAAPGDNDNEVNKKLFAALDSMNDNLQNAIEKGISHQCVAMFAAPDTQRFKKTILESDDHLSRIAFNLLQNQNITSSIGEQIFGKITSENQPPAARYSIQDNTIANSLKTLVEDPDSGVDQETIKRHLWKPDAVKMYFGGNQELLNEIQKAIPKPDEEDSDDQNQAYETPRDEDGDINWDQVKIDAKIVEILDTIPENKISQAIGEIGTDDVLDAFGISKDSTTLKQEGEEVARQAISSIPEKYRAVLFGKIIS